MFRESKNKVNWQPSLTLQTLRLRAQILNRIRQFFAEKDVLEVETPLLSPATVTDPHIGSISATFKTAQQEQTLFLQTSPEYAMKRLLAAHQQSIYQISKAFRQGDLGTFHQPEFTLLEWYRIGFDHHDLINEMDELLRYVLKTAPAERLSYAELFQSKVGKNPHLMTKEELKQYAEQNINFVGNLTDKNAWLDLIWTHCLEPLLGKEKPFIIFDFPTCQAALAKIRETEKIPVASRFEVYFKGIELANGFHELQDANEQRQRLMQDLDYRKQNNLPAVPIDEQFLLALQHGLPDCAGVALGIDRLVMLALGHQELKTAMFAGLN